MQRDITRWAIDKWGAKPGPGSELIGDCPECGKPDHLYVSTEKEVFHCFKCGFSGQWEKLIMAVEGCGYGQALGFLVEVSRTMSGWTDFMASLEGKQPAQSMHELPKCTLLEAPVTTAVGKMALGYAKRRMTFEQICEHHIGFCDDGEYAYRLIIPVERGYFQARSFVDAKPKYKNPNIPRKDVLWNRPALVYPEIYIAEGIFSAMSLGDQALALLSNQATNEQLADITSSDVRHVTVALDPDAMGLAWELGKKLVAYGKEVTIRRYVGGDPAESKEYEDIPYSLKSYVAMAKLA